MTKDLIYQKCTEHSHIDWKSGKIFMAREGEKLQFQLHYLCEKNEHQVARQSTQLKFCRYLTGHVVRMNENMSPSFTTIFWREGVTRQTKAELL